MAINLFGFYVNILEIPIIIILMVVLFHDIYSKGTKITLTNYNSFYIYNLLFLLFIFAILLSSLSAIEKSAVIKASVKWIEIFGISIIVFLFVKDVGRFKFIYWLLFISTTLSIVFLIFKTYQEKLLLFQDRILPGYDSLFALTLIIPFAFLGGKKHLKFISFLLLLSAILSLSRGVWVALLIVSVYYFYTNRNYAIFKLIAVAVPIVLFSLLLFEPFKIIISNRIIEIFSSENVSNIERVSMFKYAFIGFSQSPIWGIGALNFPHFIVKNGLLHGLVADEINVLEPHNFFLQTLTEEGVVGFIIIFLIFLNIFIILFRNLSMKSLLYDKINCYLVGLRLLFIAIFINLSFGFIANQFRFNFALFLGLTISLVRIFPQIKGKDKINYNHI